MKKSLGDEKYLFKDASGAITVEIDDDDWNGLNVTPQDLIEIRGEVDKDLFDTKIDADSVMLKKVTGGKMRILLVEDDRLIGDGLKVGLEKLGFAVDWFTDGTEGEEALYQAPYEAAVLDLGLPGLDGMEVLRRWRQRGRNEPVLILTARGDVDQRIAGLNGGADDYLGKPFALKEVQARLNALIRRRNGRPAPQLVYKNIALDPQTRRVTSDGKEIILSPREISLLELLLLNKNKVLSKQTIEDKIYSWDEEVQSNAVEVHIHHLRKKFGRDLVRTVNKIGYIMEEA